jgi:hypothetical protein
MAQFVAVILWRLPRLLTFYDLTALDFFSFRFVQRHPRPRVGRHRGLEPQRLVFLRRPQHGTAKREVRFRVALWQILPWLESVRCVCCKYVTYPEQHRESVSKHLAAVNPGSATFLSPTISFCSFLPFFFLFFYCGLGLGHYDQSGFPPLGLRGAATNCFLNTPFRGRRRFPKFRDGHKNVSFEKTRVI